MSTEQLEKLATELDIPEGVTVTYNRPMIIVQGPLGKTWKSFKKIPVTIVSKFCLTTNRIMPQIQ